MEAGCCLTQAEADVYPEALLGCNSSTPRRTRSQPACLVWWLEPPGEELQSRDLLSKHRQHRSNRNPSLRRGLTNLFSTGACPVLLSSKFGSMCPPSTYIIQKINKTAKARTVFEALSRTTWRQFVRIESPDEPC